MKRQKTVDIIGGGLAGSEAALQLANRGIQVRLFEMRSCIKTPVHKTNLCAELVCSNSLKSTKPESAAGMLKYEMQKLNSYLLAFAYQTKVAAGGALAVNRDDFAHKVTDALLHHENITLVCAEVVDITNEGKLLVRSSSDEKAWEFDGIADAILVASGPLTSDMLAASLQKLTKAEHMAFYDAAAPIVLADSLNREKVFSQSRYENGSAGDYLNAPFSKEEYEHFISELIEAECVIKKDFETKDLFQACQPIEEIARRGFDAPRFGPLKPVGLKDPSTGKRPWAVVQLRAEDNYQQSYNLVGFQTNLTFPEQKRIFRLIPGLEDAEFTRFGVMHRNTFINAPKLLSESLQLVSDDIATPLFFAGQVSGTEGYCEAIASGLVASISITALLLNKDFEPLPVHSAFGALLNYATSTETVDYQPMHVNFGILEPFEQRIRNKQERYAAYAKRGAQAIDAYVERLLENGLMEHSL